MKALLHFLAATLAMTICLATTMALAVDAYEWELTGSCEGALLIHHLRDCRP